MKNMKMTVEQIQFSFTSNSMVVHTLQVDADYSVLVVGDPENGAYEWVIVKQGRVIDHSNDAYGMCAVALRDGLIAFLG